MIDTTYQTIVFNGLGTFATTVPTAGPWVIRGKSSVPQLNTGSSAASAMITTVNQNGSPIYTSTAGAEGFNVTTNCAANDAITVVYTSAAAVDAALNVIKSTIELAQGN